MGIGYQGEHLIGVLLEAQIERRPVLENYNTQIGVVIGGQGQRWCDVTIVGRNSHAGPTPMPGRQDALIASAEIIAKIQAIVLGHALHGLGAVGEMHVLPNSLNTIPGEVGFTVDIRNPNDGH